MRSVKPLLLLYYLLVSFVQERVDGLSNPPINILGAFRPAQSTSVCGEDEVENYCIYTSDIAASLLPNCTTAQCDDSCPVSSASPSPFNLVSFAESFGQGVSAAQGRPGSETAAILFQDGSISITTASVPIVSANGFSFATWINQDEGNRGALISKVFNSGRLGYAIIISALNITLTYNPNPGMTSVSYTVDGLTLDHRYWHHVAVTIFAEDAAFYINGTVVDVTSLMGSVVDEVNGNLKLGQNDLSDSSYNGLMQDVYYYSQALTVREVVELVNGSLPFLYLSTQCHCPPSHPVVNIQNVATCTQHTAPNLSPRGTARRLNSLSRNPGYVNDLSGSNEWISSPGVRNVTVTINLTQSLYELFLVNIRYSAPRPKAAVLETSRDGGLTYRPIQYYADDCMLYFGLRDDEPITRADQANCITTASSQLPVINSNVQFRFINPGVRSFDLETSLEYRNFLLASHLRLKLIDFFTESTSLQHHYYAIQEIAIAARCACNGHASLCGSELDATCQCLNNTEGRNCEICQPTHNDKPWRYGTAENDFPCKQCRCNGHASTCIYNASVDPFPDSFDKGGGGLCQNCQDNTAGVNCDTCKLGFFRPTDWLPSDPSPCLTCGCHPSGITDAGDCVKDSGSGGQIIGQCFCKANVIGLKCQICRPGFSNLTLENPDGCSPCACNIAGTFSGQDTCSSSDGQCLCKTNVVGLRCGTCRGNTTLLRADNPNGCEECSCDPLGAVFSECDTSTGQCSCKPGVTGVRCNRCMPGFTGLSSTGCVACSCNALGSLNSTCDPVSGQCPCLANVVGLTCSTCEPGFFDISSGCLLCNCTLAGTVGGGPAACDQNSGQCPCKSNVQGRTCSTCISGFMSLLDPNPDGCSVCNCFNLNTRQSGIMCDPVTSQCECLASAMGLRCELCQDGFYLMESGCVSCNCSVDGSVVSSCDQMFGNCTCHSSAIMGRTCHTCSPGFFQFPRCLSCGCDQAGNLEGTSCDQLTGTCSCKQLVTGLQCDQCVEGYQNLEASNPFGCSALPDELAPPTLTPLSSSSVLLAWRTPEVPAEGFIQGYDIFIDNVRVATVVTLNYTSSGLSPDTNYSFFIRAFNSVGATGSAAVSARTLESIPMGLAPPILMTVDAQRISASWDAPTVSNGVISRYELVQVTLQGGDVVTDELIVFTGLARIAVVGNLIPFTLYTFIVRACTSGGCGQSSPSTVQTREAPPAFQGMPNVSTLTNTSLLIEWEDPDVPNGIVVRYEVRQREAPFQGEGVAIANVTGNMQSFVATGLDSFSEYEFSVESYTQGGSTRSMWTGGRTAESVPMNIPPPALRALSSSEILVSWLEPSNPNGIITGYMVFLGAVLLASSTEPGTITAPNLKPFTEYFSFVEICTAAGCSLSGTSNIFTLESAPSGQPPPQVSMTTASSAYLSWNSPSDPNGVISSYSLFRRSPSLLPSPLRRDVGVAFDGNIIKRFHANDNNLGGVMNTILLSFRTFSGGGTLLYYINSAGTDFIAIELRNGVPWLFFDAGSGPAVVQPDLGNASVRFDDGAWHSISATQDSRTGTIVVDGTYSGTGQSSGLDQVISSSQTLYVGGIPAGIPRSTHIGLTSAVSTLNGDIFTGCIFGVALNGQPLDFSPSSSIGEVIADIPGCSMTLEPGVSFLGGGYDSLVPNTLSTSRFSWTFDVRTSHSQGLLFFAYNTNGFALGVEIWNSTLHLVLFSNGISQRRAVGRTVCSGQWHAILIDQSLDEVFLSVDGSGRSLFLPSSNIVFSSGVFFGGVPFESAARDLARMAGLEVDVPFSGCTRSRAPGLLIDGVALSHDENRSSGSRLVRFDGCHLPESVSITASCEAPLVSLLAGADQMLNDTRVQTFSEYVYRVTAQNSAGATVSDWVSALSSPSAPSGVGVVSMVSRTSSSLTISWTLPTEPNGLVTWYEVTFMHLRTVGLGNPVWWTIVTPLLVRTPEMALVAVTDGLSPATTYSVVLSASTSGGVGTGRSVELTTDESVPIDVQVPVVIGLGSRELTVAWIPPIVPNGVITLYNLFADGTLFSSNSGNENETIVSDLKPFTEYTLHLQACTSAGCSNSSSITGQTLPDAPSGLAPPDLMVLSPSSMFASWTLPDDPNGDITRIELRRLLGTDFSAFMVEFLDASLQFQTTVTGLIPNTFYYFQLVAFNAGGSVSSEIVQALTLEDIPDQISPPVARTIDSTFLVITWSVPDMPNGDIILYNLTQDGTVIFSSFMEDLSYNITDLLPFSSYSFTIVACTVRGCGSSNQSVFMTSEATPNGYVQPITNAISSTDIALDIQPAIRPGGFVTYLLLVVGEFQNPPDEGSLLRQIVVFNSSMPAEVVVQELIPFSNYTFFLEVANSIGTLRGEPFTIMTSPAAPEEFMDPLAVLLNATTLMVRWLPPRRPNGVILSYELIVSNGVTTITTPEGLSLSATLRDLTPFTLYHISINVTNTEGSLVSSEINVTTGETAPSGFDRIVVLEMGPRHTLLSWDPPAAHNGILVNYTVLQGMATIVVTPPTTLSYNVTGLLPFTMYNFSVMACTSVGCVDSQLLVATTLEDVPEGLAAPSLSASPGEPVVIAVSVPLFPNGIILQYTVERLDPDSNLTTIGSLVASASPLTLQDTTATPFTMYSYRVLAENSVGVVVSQFSSILTPEAAPEGVLPPSLLALTSSTIQVSFLPPLSPLGNVVTYTITRSTISSSFPSPSSIFTFTPSTLPQLPSSGVPYTFNDTNLRPYTNYSYLLRVCNTGGCTDSEPSLELTLEGTPAGFSAPTTRVESSSEFTVLWVEPSMPNGMIVAYTLLQLSLGFGNLLLDCCEEYVTNDAILSRQCSLVFTTGPNRTRFLVEGLDMFSYYQYCIVVSNNAVSASSDLSPLAQTFPASMPRTGPVLNATTLNSTSIFLQWGALDISDLLGPFGGYVLYLRVAGTSGLGELIFEGEEQSFVATNLVPTSEYTFTVAVSNGVGSALSNNASATTEEGIPADLPAPGVDPISSDAFSLAIYEPVQPNGEIVVYNILLDNQQVLNVVEAGNILLEDLSPFTFYIVQLEACTRFGCTRSPLVSQRTLESAPTGLGSPFVSVTAPTSANITWSAPNNPNGNITEYRVLQTDSSSSSPTIVFSGLAFHTSVSDLRPFTTYSYLVFARNGAGNVTSIPTTVTTLSSLPSPAAPPAVNVFSFSEIRVRWVPSAELNGEFRGYQLYRNGEALFDERTNTLSLLDANLDPFELYEYVVEVCSSGGCVNSSSSSNRTFEALPEMLSKPVIISVTPYSIVLMWEEPIAPNGVIIEYIVTLLGANSMEVFRGLDSFSATASNLIPSSLHSFNLVVCNGAGCVTTDVVQTVTAETDPGQLDVPLLRNLTSTSVAIEWTAPATPNGVITTYILRRGDESSSLSQVIFQGLAFSFNDVDLAADTLYFYTITAVNGGGSLTSSPSYFQTVPDLAEGIRPPTLSVLGPTVVAVAWFAPSMANGDVSSYDLYVDNNLEFTALAFSYTVSDLQPFTAYSFFVEVCNQAGCASSTSIFAQTEQTLATGVTPPTLIVLGPTAINVSWVAPSETNGIVSQYLVERRILGDVLSRTVQHVGGLDVFTFPNFGLSPFTLYEYRLRVTNGAGSVFSEWVSSQTSEDLPSGLTPPMFDAGDIFARNATATWDPPNNPNGIIQSYLLEYRLSIDPVTLVPGEIAAEVSVPATVRNATAMGLLPVTLYEFRVVAINGAGRGEGPFEFITTAEDVPEGVQNVIVKRRMAFSLAVTWNPPINPHGIIREYLLLLGGDVVYRDSFLTYTITRLTPFTSYSIQLAACTSAGCAFGSIQSLTTAETAPFGQSSPTLGVLYEGSAIEVTWDPPIKSNGIITQYQVLRREDSIISIVNTTNDVLTRTYIDTNVTPAKVYAYAIRVINSIGRTDSEFSFITTPETAPEGLTPPTLVPLSASAIQVSWLPPTHPNGIITRYRLFRMGGGLTNASDFSDALDRGFTDVDLLPFTEYSYTLQVCTAAGCSSSPPAAAQTFEAPPTYIAAPSLVALSSSSISLTWRSPSSPNGVILLYSIAILPIQINLAISGSETELERNISNLRPFTNYTVSLEVCNSAGCATNRSNVRTLESVPQFTSPPEALVVNSTSLSITWVEPSQPNGLIIRYELRRNGSLVFSGMQTAFVDGRLSPNRAYTYTVQAYTTVGGGERSEPSITARTPPDTPEGVAPPMLVASGSTSIFANWSEPFSPNGVIVRYVLLVDGVSVHDAIGFHFEATGLSPFTSYSFQLMACTTTCGFSESVTTVTSEATPQGQPAPRLDETSPRSITVSWLPPSVPNGIIKIFEVERRLSNSPSNSLGFIPVFSGSVLLFTDGDASLRPATSYDYHVSAINNAGSTTGNFSTITLSEAPPVGVPLPIMENITATSVDVFVTPPRVTNGILTAYRLVINGTRRQTVVPPVNTFVATDLIAFSFYEFVIEACTAPGCTPSGRVIIQTEEATPTGLDPPTSFVVLVQRNIEVTWTPPRQPNGILLSYSLWHRTACPQPPQPNIQTPPSTCAPGPIILLVSSAIPSTLAPRSITLSSPGQLLPYNSYEFQVGVTNSVGSLNSTFSEPDTITLSSKPEVLGNLSLLFENGEVSLDWSQTFLLNGVFMHYDLRRNGVLLSRNRATSVTLTEEPLGKALEYAVTVVTGSGQVTGTSLLNVTTGLPTLASQTPATLTSVSTQPTEEPFYQEAAFIVSMIILAVAILFIPAATLLCYIRPRGDQLKDNKMLLANRSFQLDSTGPTKNSSPVRGPVTGSWSPNDCINGEIPDIDGTGDMFTMLTKKSFSPSSMDSLERLESCRLSDMVVANTHITSAKDDFGTFIREQQQTFQDTRV